MPNLTHRPCPQCRSLQHRLLRPFAHAHLGRCRSCGLVFTTWEPSDGELAAYYGSYPVVSSVSPVTLLRYDELLERFAAYKRTGRILDVGCGGGLFLAQAIKAGWQAHGTEYGARQIAACQALGIAITEGALDPADHPAEGFDVICSFEVIEHVVHPAREVEHMLALLRPGGLLYITTPNFNCVARRVSPATWNVASYPEHLNYFTPRTLHRLLRAKGLSRSWLITTGVSIARWKTRRNGTKEVRTNAHRTQEAFRVQLESKPHLKLAKRLANALLDLFNAGDSMKAGYIKPAGPGR